VLATVFPRCHFETADAERLSFEADSFDAVVNVESTHCYGNVPGFLAEVRRVLRPTGYFLYADFRPRSQLDAWRAELLASGMRLVEERDIMSGVLAAMDADDESKRDLIEANIDRPLINVFRQFRGTALEHHFSTRCAAEMSLIARRVPEGHWF
jgi:ubiquinone/menaquinone biosynthesis C-methylase UbiE